MRGHHFVRELPNLDDGVLREVRLVNDSYPSAWLSITKDNGTTYLLFEVIY